MRKLVSGHPFFPVLLLWLLAGALGSDPAHAIMEYRFIFFPESRLHADPQEFGLPHEEVRFTAGDGVKLHGWFLPGTSGEPVVLFCHGNAGNISHRLENLRRLHELGLSVFIFDYRGYGRSEGRASEQGTYRDARAAADWLEQRGWPASRMIYFGRSLGAAVATELTLYKPPAGLVLESAFTSVSAMGRHHNPLLFALLGWALNARYDTLARIDRIHTPILFIHGERDAIVPVKMARKLYARANDPKTLFLILGAGHNNTFESGGREYWRTWEQFLENLESAKASSGKK